MPAANLAARKAKSLLAWQDKPPILAAAASQEQIASRAANNYAWPFTKSFGVLPVQRLKLDVKLDGSAKPS